MAKRASHYEFRLHKADGRLSVVMIAQARSDKDAKARAQVMLHRGGIAKALILRDGMVVDSLYGIH